MSPTTEKKVRRVGDPVKFVENKVNLRNNHKNIPFQFKIILSKPTSGY